MLEGDGVGVVVADGNHAATMVETGQGASSVLGGPGVVTVSGDVFTRRLAADGTLGAPATVDVTPVPDVAPVVDGTGAAWVLAGIDADQAVRIGRSGQVDRRVDVEPGANELLVVDGAAAVRHDATVTALDGGATLPAEASVVPTVAVAAGETWATATDSVVAVGDDGDPMHVDVGGSVGELALWHGAVWATAGTGVGRVDVGATAGDAGLVTIDGVRGPFDVFTDGGRLWFVSSTAGVAVDRLQRATVFRLADATAEICVNDCSPTDAIDFLTDAALPETPPPTGPDTTPPPSPLNLPPVLPSTTSAPTTSTTTPTTLPPTTTTAPTTTRATTPRTAPTTARTSPPTTARTSPPTTASPPTAATTAPPTSATSTLPVIELPNLPERPNPRPRPTTTEAPPPPPSTTGPPSTTTEPPPDGQVSLVLDISDVNNGEVTISYGWRSDNMLACPLFQRRGSVAASGAGSYSDRRRMDPGHIYSGTAAVESGTLSVTLDVCGRQASRSVEIAAQDPSVSGVGIDPSPARVGAEVRASVQITAPGGWTANGASWSVGPCGNESHVSGRFDGASASVVFTPQSTATHCVSVVVSFVHSGGANEDIGRSGQVDVGGGGADPTTPLPTDPPPTDPPPPTTPPIVPPPPLPTDPPPPTTPPIVPPPPLPTDPPPTDPLPTDPPPTDPPPTDPPPTDPPPSTIDD